MGDLAYADNYFTNGTLRPMTPPKTPPKKYQETYQPRWDTWGRFVEPLASQVDAHFPHNLFFPMWRLRGLSRDLNLAFKNCLCFVWSSNSRLRLRRSLDSPICGGPEILLRSGQLRVSGSLLPAVVPVLLECQLWSQDVQPVSQSRHSLQWTCKQMLTHIQPYNLCVQSGLSRVLVLVCWQSCC